MIIFRVGPLNDHKITYNTIRFYVFWGIEYGSAHLNRAGTYDVRKGVIKLTSNDKNDDNNLNRI